MEEFIYFKKCMYDELNSLFVALSCPHREKKEGIGMGEELVVSHSDADPAHRNGEC